MNLPKSVNVAQVMGFHHVSDQIGWIKVQIEKDLLIRIVLPADLVHKAQNEWLDYLVDGFERTIQITG